MIRLSEGLKSAVLGNYGLARMMENGVIEVYSGTQPEFAHWAPTGTLLARVTKNGGVFIPGDSANGLSLDQTEAGALKDTGDWRLTGVAGGTAGWWRWKWMLADPNTTDPYYPRIDGAVGESLILLDTVITNISDIPIDRFYLTFGAA